MSNERWCIKNKKGQYLSHDDTWTTRAFAGTWEDRRSIYAILADWDGASFQHEPRIVRLRPKAPVRDEAAIRREERRRIASMVAFECDGTISFVGNTADPRPDQLIDIYSPHTGDVVRRIADAIVGLDWPVAK